jgi:hypothetical protein
MDEDGFEGARFFRKFIIRLEVYRFLQRVVFPFKPLIQDVKWQKLRRPKMELNEFMDIIKAVAKEQNFEIEGGEKQFSIEKGQWHSVAFLVKENSAGYLQVHQWESEKDNENGIWGRAVYSLRKIADVIQFCNILIMSSEIHARR